MSQPDEVILPENTLPPSSVVKPTTPLTLPWFIVKALLWLIPAFYVWYAGRVVVAEPVVALSRAFFENFFTRITGSEWDSHTLTVLTNLTGRVNELGQVSLVTPEVNVLLYLAGIPVAFALQRATGGKGEWWKHLALFVFLIPGQMWGIVLDALRQLAWVSGAEVAEQLGYSLLGKNLIGLGYQLGSLILPSLMPVLGWLLFNRAFVRSLIARRRSQSR